MFAVSILSLSWLETLDIPVPQRDAVVKVTRASNSPLPFSNILFVDIRKSGGKEIKHNFPVACSHDDDVECGGPPNSALSDSIRGYMHVKDVQPPDALQQANAFLYNLRHPVDRMFAWYQMERPEACVDKQTTWKACVTAKECKSNPHGETALFYETCFPTQDLLPLALDDGSSKISSECKALFRRVMDGKVTGPGFQQTPFQFDMRYYADKTIDLHPETNVLLLRSEHLWSDINALEKQLGGNATFHSLDNSEEYHAPNDEATYGPFCCAMMEELSTYRRLLNLAVNLDTKSKETTLTEASKRCGFDSWKEMEKQCQQPLSVDTSPLSYDNIMFVDIRKSQGSTMRNNFQIVCKLHPSECKRNGAPESALSNKVKGYMHGKTRDSELNDMIQAADAFLFDLRHPVDRILSLYHYQDPVYDHYMDSNASDASSSKAQFARNCFRRKKDGSVSRECTDIALRVTQNPHIGRGFKPLTYYTNLTADSIPSTDIVVVRAESVWDDLDDLNMKLGGKGSFGATRKEIETFDKSEDTADYASLCCALQDDLKAYRRLLERSVNLDKESKDVTIANAVKHCGFPSWESMTDQCNQHLAQVQPAASTDSKPSIRLHSPILPYEKIVFTHVGKAGGQTLRNLFRVFCTSDRKHIPVECNDAPSSMLSDKTSGYIHPREMRPEGAVDTADAFLFNLRHPVDRMISWYHYEHPQSCLDIPETRLACNAKKEVKKNPEGYTATFFQDCFPTQEYLPMAFNSSSTTLTPECVGLAQTVISGQLFERGFKHIYFNMKYYTSLTTDQYPDKAVLVVRIESLWDDFKDLDVQLGGDGSFGSVEGTKDSHGSEKYKKGNLHLATSEYALLCCALLSEMQIYRDLIDRAVNLEENAKATTIANAAQKCGFSSWSELENQCSSAATN